MSVKERQVLTYFLLTFKSSHWSNILIYFVFFKDHFWLSYILSSRRRCDFLSLMRTNMSSNFIPSAWKYLYISNIKAKVNRHKRCKVTTLNSFKIKLNAYVIFPTACKIQLSQDDRLGRKVRMDINIISPLKKKNSQQITDLIFTTQDNGFLHIILTIFSTILLHKDNYAKVNCVYEKN